MTVTCSKTGMAAVRRNHICGALRLSESDHHERCHYETALTSSRQWRCSQMQDLCVLNNRKRMKDQRTTLPTKGGRVVSSPRHAPPAGKQSHCRKVWRFEDALGTCNGWTLNEALRSNVIAFYGEHSARQRGSGVIPAWFQSQAVVVLESHLRGSRVKKRNRTGYYTLKT